MTMPPDDPYPAVRRLLDEVPPPAVRPVDVPAVYAAAAVAEGRAARFRKRVATTTAALAAGLLVFVAGRASAPPAAGADLGDMEARLVRLEAGAHRPAGANADAERKALHDLVRALAADVNDRDEKTRAAVAAVIRQLHEFEAASAARWADADRTHTALYSLTQSARKEGLNP